MHMKEKTVKFTWTPEGLYQFKVPNTYKNYLKKKKETKLEISNMVQTVDENKIGYTKRHVERAKAARKPYHIWDHQQWKHSRQC